MSLEILNNSLLKSDQTFFDGVENRFFNNFNSSSGFSLIPNSNNIEHKADKFINLTLLIGDIRNSFSKFGNHEMIYEFKRYVSNLEQTYILDDNKNHIDLAAKIYLKDGFVTFRTFGIDKPYMEVFFDENKRLAYTLTFRYKDSMNTAIELKTDSFQKYRNLLLYLGYGDIEKEQSSVAFFIREFTSFLNNSLISNDLYAVYGDIPLGLILKIQLTTEKVVEHLKILTKRDDTGFLSWAEDTSPLLIKVLGMFRKFQEVSDYFWKNPKFLNEIYDNLDRSSNYMGVQISNRIIFASIFNEIVKRSKTDKHRISANTLRSGEGYFVESRILELNDTLNTVKSILSFDFDFDYKDSIFLQQRRTYKKSIQRPDITDEGKILGNNKITDIVTVTDDVDPGYLYHPLHLVHFLDEGDKKANLVTALFIKAQADEEEWKQVVRNIRIGGDLLAIILGVLTLGSASVIAIADLGLATIDLALMSEEVKGWLSEYPEGKWFVENWDLIYGLIGAGILSAVMIDGILTYGPGLLQKIKNLKNIKSNYRIFVQELDKLVNELESYRGTNLTENAIEEITLAGSKTSIWKKIFNLTYSSDIYIEKVIKDLSTKGLSARKTKEGLYEVLYNGKPLFRGKDYEVSGFLKKILWKNVKQAAKEIAKQIPKEYNLTHEGKLLLNKWADNAVRKFKVTVLDKKLQKKVKVLHDVYTKNERPAAVSVLEGKMNGQIKRVFAYSGKGMAYELPKGLHPLVKKWLEEAPELLKSRGAHGKCAEPAAISKFLWEIDPQGKIHIEQAREAFESFVSHAIKIESKNVKAIEHAEFKPACATCDPLLEYFNIIEVN